MYKKKCKHCGKEFFAKRNDAIFCCPTCKSKYWYEHKQTGNQEMEQPAPTLQAKLKGVIKEKSPEEQNGSSSITNTKEVMVETALHREWLIKLNNVMNKRISLQKQHAAQIEHLHEVINDRENESILFGGILGTAIGDHTLKNKTNALIGAGLGGLAGYIYKLATVQKRREKKIARINSIKAKAERIRDDYTDICRQETDIRRKMLTIQRYETLIIPVPERKSTDNILKQDILSKEPPENSIVQAESTGTNVKTNVNETNNETNNDKIMSSCRFMEFDYPKLDFQGKWLEFIGKPSVTFHLAIHGKPGGGKSTFAIQLAKYLAENFGSVIYISGEEGFSVTLQEKFYRMNAAYPNLAIADLKSFDDIITNIANDKYNFLVIDSLNNMNIDAEKLKQLAERYKDSALITISQATKSGNMRGSLEIVHDADTEVKVENGIALTNKNRFKEIGKEFKVF